MKKSLLLSLIVLCQQAFSQSTGSGRLVHNSPDQYRVLKAVHAGAGEMKFTGLLNASAFTSNFLYLHAGEIPSGSGIGAHFHHRIEEMYLILDGEAEFTVNGRTALIKAPAIVPCKMGDSHGILNSGSRSLRWLNFAVSAEKGKPDNFDLNDNRVGAPKDPVPQFVSARLTKELLLSDRKTTNLNGMAVRRVLGPEIFSTPWRYVDHLLLSASANASLHSTDMEEVYYVIRGAGKMMLGDSAVELNAGDAFYLTTQEELSLRNPGADDFELIRIGVAVSNRKSAAVPDAMVLQMDFIVKKENVEAFEKMYASIYVPAMLVQQGYLGSKLLKLFPEEKAKEIQGEETSYNYQIQISFDTEENRRKWVKSDQHQIAWPAATALAESYKWRGYDVKGADQ